MPIVVGLGVLGLISVVIVGAFLVMQPGGGSSRSYKGTFSPTGSLPAERYEHTATLLSDGRVLIVGGTDSTATDSGGATAMSSVELYDPKAGTFSPIGSMSSGRFGHTATRLSDGRVLVAGGNSGTASVESSLASAELYDPKTGTFSPTGSMASARQQHTATLLSDGRVLVAGGYGAGNWLSSAELYDPKTGTFTATDTMAGSSDHLTATLLLDGRVFITEGGMTVTAELFDPTHGNNGTFAPTSGRMICPPQPHVCPYDHTATLLPDGRVLIAGGDEGRGAVILAQLYDPKTDSFSSTGSMTAARRGHTATALPDGRVLVAGGQSNAGYVASAELYDPKAGTFTATGSMAAAHWEHTATLLSDGRVMIAGGRESASAELYA
jgi:hypothetical protein